MAKQLNTAQKAARLASAMDTIQGEFNREEKFYAARHVNEAKVFLMSSPESAARLYDIIRSIP